MIWNLPPRIAVDTICCLSHGEQMIAKTSKFVIPSEVLHNCDSEVVIGAGLRPRGTSCKRHEMSSIKNGARGGVGWEGYTYLKGERLGLGRIEPLVTRVG